VAVFDADVTDATAITAAADATAEQFGGIDIAVANAGVAFVGALATAPVDHVERTLQVNLMGVWRTDAYFGFIDTDLVRGSLRNPAGAAAYALAPSFLSTSLPVTAATDALEKGIARRSARIWAPRFVGPALAASSNLSSNSACACAPTACPPPSPSPTTSTTSPSTTPSSVPPATVIDPVRGPAQFVVRGSGGWYGAGARTGPVG